MKRVWGTIASLVVLITVTACGSSGNVDAHGNWTSGSTPSASPQPSQTAAPNPPTTSSQPAPPVSRESTPPTTAKSTGTVREYADNQLGVPVFKDTRGAAPDDPDHGRIPYGIPVMVDCYADNASGMSSVNFFYHIVGGTWNNLYAPANTFDNGAGLGPNPVNLDSRVPKCA